MCDKMVRKLLSDEQKDQRQVDCEDILQHLQEDPEMVKRIITGDGLGFFNMIQRQSAKSSMEMSWISKTKEDSAAAHNSGQTERYLG